MRIAMFSETFLPGTDGVVTRLCATLRHLEEERHEVLLFAPQGAPETYASATIVGVPSFRFNLYPEKKFARPIPRVGKALKKFQPDLIHSVNPGFLSFAAIYYARWLGIPLLASYHTHIPSYARYYHLTWLEPFLWFCFRTIHNRAAINLCPSKATLRELESRGFRNLAVWERGVDLELFSPRRRSETMRFRLLNGTDSEKKILLFVGRLASEKGIQRLRTYLDQMPNLHLAIVGEGPYRTELEKIFESANVTFLGYLFGEELAEAYASADGFIFPSTTETLGLVLYEAMASGLPIIAAESPATREVLQEGQAGFMFDPLDPKSIMDTVKRFLNDEPKRVEVQTRTAQIVEKLDWSGPTKQLVHYYRNLFQSQQTVMAHFPQE